MIMKITLIILKMSFMMMADTFIAQDLYVKHEKKLIKSDVKPLTCHVCKKELNGISITAKILKGNMVFLCSRHYQSDPYDVVSVN
jgi:hypothetical protein